MTGGGGGEARSPSPSMAAAAAVEIKWAMRLGDEQSGEENVGAVLYGIAIHITTVLELFFMILLVGLSPIGLPKAL
jgi:hypothetical protein